MRTISVSEFRRDLAAVLDSVTEDREPILIMRRAGKAPVVLMSIEDYASHEETHHLLRSPANAARLLTAIADLDGTAPRARSRKSARR